MTALDLTAIREELLNRCGSCDATACVCPKQDYRPTMLALVREVERLRAGLKELVVDFDEIATTARANQDESWRTAKTTVIACRALLREGQS